jgi:hypothetical protein
MRKRKLDVWVEHYNHQRPHQGIGMVPPFERFRLARAGPATIELEGAAPEHCRDQHRRRTDPRIGSGTTAPASTGLSPIPAADSAG